MFLTIVFGFASVITLAQINIMSDISNARQTISKISITEDGTDSAQLEMEISSEGIYINSGILDVQTTFSGKVLGIDEEGNLIYVLSEDLIVSWIEGWTDGTWTVVGNDIYRYTGNVGIGTTTPTSKFHIVNSWSTDVYIEEQASWMAANLNLKNTARTRAIGGDSNPDIFYIGEAGGAIDLAITPAGNVGIGTNTPTSKLQIVGNFIAGWEHNNIEENMLSAIIAGDYNEITWRWPYRVVMWGVGNRIYGMSWGTNNNTDSSSIVWGNDNVIHSGINNSIGWWYMNNIYWGNHSTIVGGSNNMIYTGGTQNIIGWWQQNIVSDSINWFIWWWQLNKVMGYESAIVWGRWNKITPNAVSSSEWIYNFIGGWNNNNMTGNNMSYWFIGGWRNNTITKTNYATIVGGRDNNIQNAQYTFIGGWEQNTITGTANYSTIPWWKSNTITDATYSISAGNRAKNLWYNNTFVWNSDISADFNAGKENSFLINVPGGVGINTANPQYDLDVNGTAKANSMKVWWWDTAISLPVWICTEEWTIKYITIGWSTWGHFYGCRDNWTSLVRVQLD